MEHIELLDREEATSANRHAMSRADAALIKQDLESNDQKGEQLSSFCSTWLSQRPLGLNDLSIRCHSLQKVPWGFFGTISLIAD